MKGRDARPRFRNESGPLLSSRRLSCRAGALRSAHSCAAILGEGGGDERHCHPLMLTPTHEPTHAAGLRESRCPRRNLLIHHMGGLICFLVLFV